MKSFNIFLFILAVSMTNLIAQPTGKTFNVCKVEKAMQPINTKQNPVKPYMDVVEQLMVTDRNEEARRDAIQNDKNLDYKKQYKLIQDKSYFPKDVPQLKLEATSVNDKELIQTNFHPFMETLHLAYANHYPVTISPDMIWLLIAQGFAIHVNENAEELRQQFVNFDGKKKIDVRRDRFVKGSKDNDWPGVFEEFGEKIEANTGADLLDLVTGDFSTTGPTEKVAFQVTLMDAMKSYFIYSVTTSCGIPEITLEGTPEDWKKIEEKAKQLAQYDLEWWTKDLLPVLKQFTKASSGKPDKDFWQSIYKWTEVGSGSPYITGWILHLFPYYDYSGKYVKKTKQKIWVDGKTIETYSATTSSFPNGFSQADFVWNYHETYYKMEFLAGFTGCYQDPKTLTLRPEISWAVIDKQMMASDEDIENYKKGGDKKYREFMNKDGANE